MPSCRLWRPTCSSDRYRNMKCVINNQTNAPCPNWSFNGNNQISTSLGSSYDATEN
jgi:hypothetical protein